MARLVSINIASSTDSGDKSKSTGGDHVNQMLGEFHLPLLFPSNPEHHGITDDPVTIEQRCFDWPNDLIDHIKQVMSSSCNTPSPPEFKFEMTEEATKHNLKVLEKYKFSLKKALDALTFRPRQGVPATRHPTFGLRPAPTVESDGGHPQGRKQ